VPDEFQVSSLADEGRLHRELAAHFYFPDENSLALIGSLYSALDMQAPFFMPVSVLKAFTGKLLDSSVAGRLGLETSPVPGIMLRLLQIALPMAGKRYQLAPFLRNIELERGRNYFHNLIARGLAGVEADFRRQGAA
jgi:hypothetical protein